MSNNRSESDMRWRMEIAEKATPEGEKTLWIVDGAVPRDLCIRDAFNERILTMEDCTAVVTARHIAASSPDVVREDIEEILRLRQEVARLNKEADWLVKILSNYTEECPYRFHLIYEERIPITPVDGCEWQWPECHECDIAQKTPGKCWREAARKAVEDENG